METLNKTLLFLAGAWDSFWDIANTNIGGVVDEEASLPEHAGYEKSMADGLYDISSPYYQQLHMDDD